MLEVKKEKIDWLFGEAKRIVNAARVAPPCNGTWLYHPDGSGNYRGIWCRDFAYIVENVPELLPPPEIKAAYYYLIRHQRADGGLPASVSREGKPGYITVGKPEFTDSDNSQFAVKIAYDYYKYTGDIELFASTIDRLKRAMDFVPRSSAGLVWIDPDNPHTGYGFTDVVLKSGNELFSSLLYWEACRKMAEIYREIEQKGLEDDFLKRAMLIEKNINALWNDDIGAFYAATIDERKIDIWGNAYLVYIGFPVGEKLKRVQRFLVDNYNKYVYKGQVRHLLKGEYWEKTIYRVPKDTYQQGAYWGTASGWVMYALAQEDVNLASSMANELIDYYQTYGIYECVNIHYNKIRDYVASIVNPVGTIKHLLNGKCSGNG